jgi:CBS domain-containing protein
MSKARWPLPVGDAAFAPPLRGVRRAPVVAASGDLVGIVSTDDLLGIIAEQLGSLAHLLDRQTRSAAR